MDSARESIEEAVGHLVNGPLGTGIAILQSALEGLPPSAQCEGHVLLHMLTMVVFADQQELTRRRTNPFMKAFETGRQRGQGIRVAQSIIQFLQIVNAGETTQAMRESCTGTDARGSRQHCETVSVSGDALFTLRTLLGDQLANTFKLIETRRLYRIAH